MNDRELLELAARAAGYEVHIWGDKDRLNCARIDVDLDSKWNPIADDGDALRLAATLSLCIFVNGMFVHADCKHCPG